MEKELSTLDQYLIDPDWGKPKLRKQVVEKSDEIF